MRVHFRAVVTIITVVVGFGMLFAVNSYRSNEDVSVAERLRPFVIPDVVNGAVERFNQEIERIKEMEDAELQVSDGQDASVNDEDDDDDDDEETWAVDSGEKETMVEANSTLIKIELGRFMTRMQEKMTSRRETLRAACTKLGIRKRDPDKLEDFEYLLGNRGHLDTFYWDDHYRFISSAIHKCGSGNWRKFMKSLKARKDRPTVNLPSGIKNKPHNPTSPLTSLPIRQSHQELTYRLKNYLKIVTVRHPLIRFVSAYRDKFIEHTDKFRKDIAKMILSHRAKKGSGSGNVTFSEFVEFVTTPKMYAGLSVDKRLDTHWTPQHMRSRPCAHDFDLIAKLETSVEDMAYIKSLFGVGDMTFLAEYMDRHVTTNNETMIVTYYQQLTEEAFQSVVEFFSTDFELFGYYRPKSIDEVQLIFKDFA